MSKCPHCKYDIDHLTFHEHNIGEVRIATEDSDVVKKGDLDFSYDYGHRWTDYSCPECRSYLLDTAEKALQFLKHGTMI